MPFDNIYTRPVNTGYYFFMIYKGVQIPFPAITQISFSKLIEKLKVHSSDDISVRNTLSECDQFPEILSGISELEFNKDHALIKKICSTLFPEVLRNNEIKGIIPPFDFRPFYVSNRFKQILDNSGEDFSFVLNDFDADQLYIFGCASILSFYYKYPFLLSLPIVTTIPVKETGINRTYRIVMNGDLLEIEPTEKALEISHNDYLELLNNFNDIELWKQKFPPGSWLFKGIGIINLFDITQDQSVANITTKLVVNPLQHLSDILEDLKLFLGINALSIGFLSHGSDAFSKDISGLENIILQNKQQLSYRENLCANSYKKLIEHHEPIIITDVEFWNTTDFCSIASTIIGDLAYGSYMLLPIQQGGEMLGYLELGSPLKYALNGSTLVKMNVLLPMLAMAINRNRNELKNRQDAIIQQYFTTIHPSVKWRFQEEALKILHAEDEEQNVKMSDILFPEVYALYGQFDIRGSSKRRNDAVKSDLTTQLSIAEAILKKVIEEAYSPIYEELLFRVQSFQQEMHEELLSGSEQSIVYFFETDIHPLFDQLLLGDGSCCQPINEYFALLHPELKIIYNVRNSYDNSVLVLNQWLSLKLDKKQLEAQSMFPHYFERYKTDGIEYNMYIGQSISHEKEFKLINLHNLQLWQLITTCELEKAYPSIQSKLELPLEIASLILVYSSTLAIHFRLDEKRFDVAGAYNARYEIVKKRIDKVHIKDTDERLTCPGKISIIYSNPQDASTYERYILFMENKGYIVKGSLERMELEDLPGVSGLKALRVTIDYSTG